MRFEKYIMVIFVGVLLFFIAALSAVYRDVRDRTIDDLNMSQTVYARQAARGIQDHMGAMINTLNLLARFPGVIEMNAEGRSALNEYQVLHSDEIKGITRVDVRGRIVATYPNRDDAIGKDISDQEHVREILKTRKTVISDVFTAVQGFRTIAVHVPVFRSGVFDGTIGVLLSFDRIAQRHIENIRIGKNGYAWVITGEGVEISCPVPGHVGRSVYDTCRDFPDILAMAKEMVKGRQGTTTYTFDKIRGTDVEKVLKHAVYMPIPIANNFWSIVVATPEDEVLTAMAGFRTKFLLITLALLAFSTAFTFLLARSRVLMREQEKREGVMKALSESELKYRTLIETTGTGFVIVDLEGRVIDANQEYVRLSGHAELGEILGHKVLEWTADHEKQKNEEAMRQCFRNGHIRNLEVDYVDREGTSRPSNSTPLWLSWKVFPGTSPCAGIYLRAGARIWSSTANGSCSSVPRRS